MNINIRLKASSQKLCEVFPVPPWPPCVPVIVQKEERNRKKRLALGSASGRKVSGKSADCGEEV